MRVFALAILTATAAVCAAISMPLNPKTSREIVKSFETIHPQVLRRKRHTRNIHPDSLDVQVTSNSGETFTLQLTLNDKLIAPQFSSVFFEEDGKEIKITDQENCFYHGKVLEHPEWKVAMDSCQGLRGSFGDWSNKTQHYNVEPLSQDNKSLEQPHALYLADDTEEDGECGTKHEDKDDILNPLNLDEEELERARRQSPTGDYIIELCIVNDNAQYRYYQRDISRTVSRAMAVINVADRIYQSVNVRIVLVYSITWTTGDRSQFSSSPETTLQRFRTYSLSVRESFDAIMLLTGNGFAGRTVGIAYLNTMCGSRSTGVVQDRHSSTARTGSIMAHEMGHILSLQHDTPSCSCVSRRCVMGAVLSFPPPEVWSSCSVTRLRNALTRSRNSLGRCLENEPTAIVGDPVCGNGIREGDEICDCGNVQECNDPCCDARTCRPAADAQCTKGDCCTSTCRFKGAGTTCRGSRGQCDIRESCTGQSAECPADVFLLDGSSCDNNQAFCFSGQCKTYDAQCQKHFRTNKGVDECFTSYNTEGSYFGNCGSNGNSFIGCSRSDVMCGQLFCKPGDFQNTINSVYVLEVGVYVPSTRRVEQCVAFTPPATSDVMSPGLVDDGIKCGSGRMCYEQRCVSVSSIGFPQCPTGSNGRVCSGNGKCNNRGRCSCNAGSSGSACDSNSTPSVNECLTNNGGCTHICTDTANSHQCQCRTGYRLASDGKGCTDINECSEGSHNCAQRCSNTAGSFTCSCNSGYRLASDGRTCNDINECIEQTSNCVQRCSNTQGSFVCSCNSGYRLASNRRTCTDINECSEGHHNCQQRCTNTAGSYTCSCSSGYRLASNRRTCDDINECSEGNSCQQRCTNTAGSYTCSCNSGYTLAPNRQSCTALATCGGRITAEGSGSFQSPGWPNNYPQQDLQCEWIFDIPTDGYALQFTIDDSHYGINGRTPCPTDYIQFLDGTGSSAKSLQRLCGFTNPGPIDASSAEAKVVFSSTVNLRRPSSRVGVRVSYTLVDMDECDTGAHSCQQKCQNTAGSYTCSCNSGYTLAADGRSCTADPVAPTEPDGICGGRLTASSGSFQSPGWPRNYPQDNFQCEWTIELPNSRSAIEFNIDSSAYGINGRAPCNSDYIEFFDGTNDGARSIHKLCKFDNPGPFRTTFSQARVVFNAQINPRRPQSRVGVKVNYKAV